jgi:hypothetical protein
MRLEARKYLFDIKQAADLLAAFANAKHFADYQQDAMLPQLRREVEALLTAGG